MGSSHPTPREEAPLAGETMFIMTVERESMANSIPRTSQLHPINLISSDQVILYFKGVRNAVLFTEPEDG